MVMWLAELLGLKEITIIAKWALRLMMWAFLLLLLGAVVAGLIWSPQTRIAALVIAALAVGVPVFRALWNRNSHAEVGERTIDGKVVPDMLAVAALDIPAQSPDGDYVLRGLPDYGKALLKLNSADFEYVPEIHEEKLPEPPIEEPAVIPAWHRLSPRLAIAAFLVVVGVVGIIIKAPWNTVKGQDVPQLKEAKSLADSDSFAAQIAHRDAQRQARLEIDKAAGIWRDSSTGLVWPLKDNGPEPITFQAAERYCDSLELGGLKDWRLPSQPEIKNLWKTDEMTEETNRGGIQFSQPIEILWSETLGKGVSVGMPLPTGNNERYWHTLCVHD